MWLLAEIKVVCPFISSFPYLFSLLGVSNAESPVLPIRHLIHICSRDEVAQSIHSGDSAGLALTLPLDRDVIFRTFLNLSEPQFLLHKMEKKKKIHLFHRTIVKHILYKTITQGIYLSTWHTASDQ